MKNFRFRPLRRAWDKVGSILFGGGDRLQIAGEFRLIARDPKVTVSLPGITVKRLLWDTDWFANQVMTAAVNDMLSVTYNGGTQKAQWYIAPINNTPSPSIVAGDTAASHAGWAEATTYSEGTRQEYNPTVSNKVMTNSASAATITASGSVSVYGAFIISDNTKSGTSGVLGAAGAFTGGVQALSSTQTLDLLYRQTVSN